MRTEESDVGADLVAEPDERADTLLVASHSPLSRLGSSSAFSPRHTPPMLTDKAEDELPGADAPVSGRVDQPQAEPANSGLLVEKCPYLSPVCLHLQEPPAAALGSLQPRKTKGTRGLGSRAHSRTRRVNVTRFSNADP